MSNIESFGDFPHSIQSDILRQRTVELCYDFIEIDVLFVFQFVERFIRFIIYVFGRYLEFEANSVTQSMNLFVCSCCS